ncbi:MAG TPA: TVP38/TMEM64 family protein [Pirellulales bacterium]|nr:TVP38/TMEM64 family protein [Pirellulales bacterium]
MNEELESTAPRPSRVWIKLVVLGIVAAAIAAGFYFLGDSLSLENLAQQEKGLRQFQKDHPILVYAIAYLVYVTVTGLSLPGAAALTLVYGWYFGLLRGVILVSFASTSGATIAFLLSRYLFRDAIQNKFGDRLESFNRALEREGAFYLFTLRLIPAVPFFVINVVMGLTPVRVPTYWWVSQLGMLPGTIAFVFAGSTFPDLTTLAEKGAGGVITLPLIIAFVILGLFPLLVKKIMQRFRKTPPTQDMMTRQDEANSLGDVASDPSNPYRPPG